MTTIFLSLGLIVGFIMGFNIGLDRALKTIKKHERSNR